MSSKRTTGIRVYQYNREKQTLKLTWAPDEFEITPMQKLKYYWWPKFKQALGVKSFDLYSQLLGGLEGKLEQISATGGDEESGGSSNNKTNRFTPVVRFFGPFHLEKGQLTYRRKFRGSLFFEN